MKKKITSGKFILCKRFTLFLIVSLYINVCEGQKLPSVCNVEMGSTYEKVLSTLRKEHGTPTKFSKEDIFYDKELNLAGFTFNGACFSFIPNYSGKWMLSSAIFTRQFDANQINQAKAFRDKIAKKYKTKYKNLVSIKNKQGYIQYLCGQIPNNIKTDEGYPIKIILEHQIINDNIIYWVAVEYGVLVFPDSDMEYVKNRRK